MSKSIFIPEDSRSTEFELPRSKVKVVMREGTVTDSMQLASQAKITNKEGNQVKQNLIYFSLICTFNGVKMNAADLQELHTKDYYFMLDKNIEMEGGEGNDPASKK